MPPEPTPEEIKEITKKVDALFGERKEALGVYKSCVRGSLDSVDKLFKIDDSLINLFIKPKTE